MLLRRISSDRNNDSRIDGLRRVHGRVEWTLCFHMKIWICVFFNWGWTSWIWVFFLTLFAEPLKSHEYGTSVPSFRGEFLTHYCFSVPIVVFLKNTHYSYLAKSSSRSALFASTPFIQFQSRHAIYMVSDQEYYCTSYYIQWSKKRT